MKLFTWDPPGPYAVAFSTRVGGVSEGAFESLNLGRKQGDVPERVDENRRRVCADLGVDVNRLALGYQFQSAIVNRAEPGLRGVPGDGLWTDEAGLPVMALGADCLLIALARRNGGRPGVAAVHAGWRGLLEGIVEAAVATVGGRPAAAIGPAIGPCCYEVGEDVAAPFCERFGKDVLRDGKLDLWTAGERALMRAGCSSVERLDLCTACRADLFFSQRRMGRPRGTQAVLAAVV